ncbi:conjugal transfer protein TrbI [Pectobacterium carotovorum]|uniref:TrbI/VirB10 family protein n=1 Tax=Pectobacterium versatile TaxID=2488639 RepID=UPI000C7EDDF4|nr:TrbI/VirB10 family protein [Pectobacterium versatile]PLY35830.1 conjugal transfer protein TrbI [Pectobacterium carotovorum]
MSNDISPQSSDLSVSNVQENKIGQGGFSLKPAGRKTPINWKIVAVIIGGIIFVLVFTIFFAALVIKSREEPETEIDESKIKTEVVTQGNRRSEDVMGEYMEANRPTVTQEQPTTVTAQPNTPVDKQDNNVSNTDSAKAAEHNTDSAAKAPREPETMFAPIARFDSSGMSQGTGGNSDSSGGRSSDAEERLRAFANADPTELVNQALRSQGGNNDLSGSTSGRGGLLSELEPSRNYATAKAYMSPARKYLLKRQTRFQCVLYNGVKTDYPGYISCYLLRPLYSSDGSTVLAEAGAELNGEQNVEVKAGQSSIFTAWTQLETAPEGVRASLNGLGTDSMGRSGTDSYIDNHYGQRFGGAVMLSFIKDALSSASNATKKNSDGYSVDNTEQNAEDMASKALENSINIPPTGYVLPGTVITVIVAQDIDFSSVYKIRRR